MAVFQQTGVRDALKDSLAVFVAGTGVADGKRLREALEGGVGFVNDDSRTIVPLIELSFQ